MKTAEEILEAKFNSGTNLDDMALGFSRRILEAMEEYANQFKHPSLPVEEEVKIGDKVFHSKIYDGRELMEVVGIRKDSVELQGDYSGGTHNVCQVSWMPKKGIIKAYHPSSKEPTESKEGQACVMCGEKEDTRYGLCFNCAEADANHGIEPKELKNSDVGNPPTEIQKLWNEINSLRSRVEWLESRPDNI